MLRRDQRHRSRRFVRVWLARWPGLLRVFVRVPHCGELRERVYARLDRGW